VATFSVLADIVKQVGGETVTVSSLVAAGGDSHVFEPQPAHARQLAAAALVVTNGLGFEGWIDRLIRSSGYRGAVAVATENIEPLRTPGRSHGKHVHEGSSDPHAWHSVPDVKIYVQNIANALCEVDPSSCGPFRSNAARYTASLDLLDRDIRSAITSLPLKRRTVITAHDAFAYYAREYGIKFTAPVGISTDAKPSAAAVARLIRQIRRERVDAFFIESISDSRLIDRIRSETGGAEPGRLYSDSLSELGGPAASYEAMMRYNTQAIVSALKAPKDSGSSAPSAGP
jgi:zinc/manganese transport system substrate-binding protein